MSETLAVVNIGQLATLAGPERPRVGAELHELGLIADAALLVKDGYILQAGAYRELKDSIPDDAEIVDAEGRLVTPGFVDAHTHLIFAGTRAAEFELRLAGATYSEIAAAGGGILSTVRLTRAATEEELLASARKHLEWMRRSGTTTVEVKSGYGLDLESEIKMLCVARRLGQDGRATVVPTLLAAHTVPPEFRERRGEYVSRICDEMIPLVAREKLATFCDVFCDDHAFTVDEARRIFAAAKAHGLGLRVHAEQFRPGTGAELAAEVGARTADHLEAVDEPAMQWLAQAGVQPVLLPGSVFALNRNEYPPARRMVEMGLAVVLATDFNPGSSPLASVPMMQSLACLKMGMTPAEALVASTVNAAWSLHLGPFAGSLETGKRADFLVHEFRDFREIAYFVAAPARPRVFVAGREGM